MLDFAKKMCYLKDNKKLSLFYNDAYNSGKRKKNLTKIERVSTF